jgi:hypothetical protein
MTQADAVIDAMRRNGGYATLGHLYQEALKVSGVEWNTKTPFKSINRIVQDPRFFYKIKPGLWALKDSRDQLVDEPAVSTKPESDHYFYQGLLVELGNMQGFQSFVPRPDRGKHYLSGTLGAVATLDEILPFTYPEIVKRASMVDVIWFGANKFPVEFIEVEHSTDFNVSLLKFADFQPFNSKFRIVASTSRHKQFLTRIEQRAFESLKPIVKFTSYDVVSELHSKWSALLASRSLWA